MTEKGNHGYFARNSRFPAKSSFMSMNMRPGTRVTMNKKKTMTAAHTLYGVTMQESGVSKQVSVSFEDVSEDGHISADAIKRSEHTQDDAA